MYIQSPLPRFHGSMFPSRIWAPTRGTAQHNTSRAAAGHANDHECQRIFGHAKLSANSVKPALLQRRVWSNCPTESFRLARARSLGRAPLGSRGTFVARNSLPPISAVPIQPQDRGQKVRGTNSPTPAPEPARVQGRVLAAFPLPERPSFKRPRSRDQQDPVEALRFAGRRLQVLEPVAGGGEVG